MNTAFIVIGIILLIIGVSGCGYLASAAMENMRPPVNRSDRWDFEARRAEMDASMGRHITIMKKMVPFAGAGFLGLVFLLLGIYF